MLQPSKNKDGSIKRGGGDLGKDGIITYIDEISDTTSPLGCKQIKKYFSRRKVVTLDATHIQKFIGAFKYT